MKLGVLKAIGAVTAGVTLTGSIITWNGSQTIINTKSLIQEAKTKLGIYSSNEKVLLDAIDYKNEEIEHHLNNIETLRENIKNNRAKIKELEDKVAILEKEKAELEEQLENLGSVSNIIAQLTEEVNKANSDVSQLQTELENSNIDNYDPDSLELNDLISPSVTDLALSNLINYNNDKLWISYIYSNSDKFTRLKNKTDDIMTIEITYSSGEVVRELVEANNHRTINNELEMVNCTVFNKIGKPILYIK